MRSKRTALFPAPATILVTAALCLCHCAKNKGECNPECGAGQQCCGGFCKNIRTDPQNCGGCGNVCAPGQVCQEGTCVGETCDPPCGTNEDCCPVSGSDPECANLDIDSDHCGACGHACTGGETCSSGVCTSTPCDPPDCGGDPWRCCSGTCVNTDTDFENCGSCAHDCGEDQADACSGGRCQCNSAPACYAGQKCCPDVGCRNIQSDINNCGDCGVACDTGLTCNEGVCNCGGDTCAEGYGCCSGYCKDLRYDSTNCGTCGHRCGANGPACVDGSCVCGDDTPCTICGFITCSEQTPPGPYTDCELCCPLRGGCFPNSDENCGACGTACSSGERCEPVMSGFSCVFQCVPTWSTDASTDPDA